MYDFVHQLCNAIQAMAIYNLSDSQSPTLFNQKLFLPLLLPPSCLIFCFSVLSCFASVCHVPPLNLLCINASVACHKCLSVRAGQPENEEHFATAKEGSKV